MRDIKFRGKDLDTGEWRYGFYVQHQKVTLCPFYESKARFDKDKKENTEDYIVFDGFSDWNLPRQFLRAQVKGETIGQYTGMQDGEGKEIYENDILRCNNGDWLGLVKWQEKEGRWTLRTVNHGQISSLHCFESKEIIVVGNIYDNPNIIDKD